MHTGQAQRRSGGPRTACVSYMREAFSVRCLLRADWAGAEALMRHAHSLEPSSHRDHEALGIAKMRAAWALRVRCSWSCFLLSVLCLLGLLGALALGLKMRGRGDARGAGAGGALMFVFSLCVHASLLAAWYRRGAHGVGGAGPLRVRALFALRLI